MFMPLYPEPIVQPVKHTINHIPFEKSPVVHELKRSGLALPAANVLDIAFAVTAEIKAAHLNLHQRTDGQWRGADINYRCGARLRAPGKVPRRIAKGGPELVNLLRAAGH